MCITIWRLLVIGLFSSIGAIVIAADLDSCASDLDDLRRAARDATDKATEAQSKEEELKRCKNDPYGWDYKYDRCGSKASYLRSAISDLSSELDNVDHKIRSIQSACGYQMSTASPVSYTVNSSGDNLCDLYRSYRGKLPYDSIVKTCSQYMPAEECRRCLAFKLSGK